MMYGRPWDTFFLVLTVWVMFIPLIVFGVMTDKIEINVNNDFLDEYNSCQTELERTQPICPECKCVVQESESHTAFWNFFGIFEGAVLMYYFMSNKDRIFKWIRKKLDEDKKRRAS